MEQLGLGQATLISGKLKLPLPGITGNSQSLWPIWRIGLILEWHKTSLLIKQGLISKFKIQSLFQLAQDPSVLMHQYQLACKTLSRWVTSALPRSFIQLVAAQEATTHSILLFSHSYQITKRLYLLHPLSEDLAYRHQRGLHSLIWWKLLQKASLIVSLNLLVALKLVGVLHMPRAATTPIYGVSLSKLDLIMLATITTSTYLSQLSRMTTKENQQVFVLFLLST